MNISLLGPPGSGKGTMSRRIASATGMGIFETGTFLRKYARENDPELEKHLAAGGMAGKELVMKLLAQGTSSDNGNGWVLDGVPRNEEQAVEILKLLRNGSMKIDLLIVLEAADETVARRLSARRMCQQCSATYNDMSNPSPAGNQCGLCGGELGVRTNDTPEGIQRRLDLYHQKTTGGIRVMEEGGVKVAHIDADRDEEQVFGAIIGSIRKADTPSAPLKKPRSSHIR